jgi:hypothetical protein
MRICAAKRFFIEIARDTVNIGQHAPGGISGLPKKRNPGEETLYPEMA